MVGEEGVSAKSDFILKAGGTNKIFDEGAVGSKKRAKIIYE